MEWRPIQELQEAEFAAEAEGYTATKHQREVGTGYFDEVAQLIAGESSTTALHSSTEQGNFIERNRSAFARLTDSRLATLCAEGVRNAWISAVP
jgi:hypothetical protein